MATATDTVVWNEVYTAHAHTYLNSEPKDQYFLKTPTLTHLRSQKRTEDGGEQLVVTVLNGSDAVGGPVAKNQAVDVVDVDTSTAARYSWAFYAEPIVINHQDEKKVGKGAQARFKLLETKIRHARLRLVRKVAQDVFATSQVVNGLTGLPLAIVNDPTASGAYGGLDGAAGAQTWWRNKSYVTVGSAASNLIDKMDALWDDCIEGSDSGVPNLIVTTKAVFQAYEKLVRAKQNIWADISKKGAQMGDLGFPTLFFNGCAVVWDPYCPTGTMWFINDEAIQLILMPDGEFTLSEGGFQSQVAQGIQQRVALLRLEGQIGVIERRALGKLDGITVP